MTTRTCSQVARVIGVRPSELDASLRAHVERCAECTRELEALERIVDAGREIDLGPVDPARTEQRRARLLEAARRSAGPRASRTPIVVAGLAVAVAVAMVAMLAVDRFAPAATATPRSEALALSEPPTTVARTHGAVRASAGAHFTLLSDAPDEIVRLVEGAITVSVTPLSPGERFRVVVGDAEVEVRGTAFEVAAQDDRLESVDVLHGAVEVRLEGSAPTLVHAGERWARTVEDASEVENAAPIDETASVRASRPRAPAPPSIDETRSRAPSWTAASGFETGWSALHDGDPLAAATAFGEVLARAPRDPLAEDASFWRAVAWSRAERTTEARVALESFVRTYPRSVRAPEASVMLGWLLLSSGEREGARAMFERGTNDPSERVRASAARGLAAIPAAIP